MLLARLNRGLTGLSKIAFQPILYHKLCKFESNTVDNHHEEELQARNSAQIITQRIQELEVYKETINKGLEIAFTDLVRSKQKLTRVSTALEHVRENIGLLRLSTKGLFADNKYGKFIIDKALEILRQNFSPENLTELIEHCKLFEIDDPKVYISIGNIISKRQDSSLTLRLRLQLMTEFNQTLPIVDIEELLPLSSLDIAESIYLLHLIKLYHQIDLKQLDENNIQLIEEIDHIELQEKVIREVAEAVENEDLDCLHTLFVALAHINESELKSKQADLLRGHVDLVAAKIEPNVSELSTHKIVLLYSALQRHLSRPHGEQILNLASKVVDLLRERVGKMTYKDIEELLVTIYKSQEISNTSQIVEAKNRELFIEICTNILPTQLKHMNISSSLLIIILNLCSKYRIWKRSLCEIFFVEAAILYDTKRITANVWINLMITITNLNQGKPLYTCFYFIKNSLKDLLVEADIPELIDLDFEIIKSAFPSIKRKYRKGVEKKILAKMKKCSNVYLLEVLLEYPVLPFVIKNMELFDREVVETLSKRLEGIIHNLSTKTILSIHFTVVDWFRAGALNEGKPQLLLYVLESQVQKTFDSLTVEEQNDYFASAYKLIKRVKRYQDKHKELAFVPVEEYESQEIETQYKIPLCISIIKEHIKQEIQVDSKSLDSPVLLGQNLLASILLAPEENLDNVLESIWANFKAKKINLFFVYRVLKGNEALAAQFKEKVLDKDPQAQQTLIEAICEDLKQDQPDTDIPVDEETQAEDSTTSPRNSYIFGMLSLIGTWGFVMTDVKKPLLAFILRTINYLGVDDFQRILNMTGNLFVHEKRYLFQPLLDRLPSLMEKNKMTSTQAYAIFMGMANSQMDKKTMAHLIRTITADFGYLKVQDMVKLVEKLDRFKIKSIKILWKLQSSHLRKDNITELTPWQVKALAKIFLKENYGDIGEAVRLYLVINKSNIPLELDLCELLFGCTKLARANFSQDFIGLISEIPQYILKTENTSCFLYLLGALEMINQSHPEQPPKDQLISKWDELLTSANLDELMNASKAIEYLSYQSDFNITFPWVRENLIKNISERESSQVLEESIIRIFCLIFYKPSDIAHHSEVFNRCIPTFISKVQDAKTVTRFVFIAARSFANILNSDIIKEMRRKIMSLQPHHFYDYEVLANFVKVIIEADKNMSEELKSGSLLTLKDYKLFDRIQYLIMIKIDQFTNEDLCSLSQVLAQCSSMPLRSRELVANKIFQTDTGDEKSNKYHLIL